MRKIFLTLFLLFVFSSTLFGSELIVTVIDVGSIGDSILIQTPRGKNILIDGGFTDLGEFNDFWDAGKDIVIPFLKKKGIKKIDIIVASHAHADHIGGLIDVMDEFEVGEVLEPGYPYTTRAYRKFLEKIKEKGIPYSNTKRGDILDWEKELKVEVFSPPKKFFKGENACNNSSIVIKLTYKKVSFLFNGDIEREVEKNLVENYGEKLKSTILKVPHHGSDTSSTVKFLKMVKPECAIIPIGKNNTYSFPNSGVVEKYEVLGIRLYRTDLDGNVSIRTDGIKYEVKTETPHHFGRTSLKEQPKVVGGDIEKFYEYAEKGWTLMKNKKFKEGIEEIKMALEINPDSSDARSKLGYGYKKIQEFKLAEKEFKKAISLNSKEFYARLHLGLMYMYQYKTYKTDIALKLFKECLEIEPEGKYTEMLREKIEDLGKEESEEW